MFCVVLLYLLDVASDALTGKTEHANLFGHQSVLKDGTGLSPSHDSKTHPQYFWSSFGVLGDSYLLAEQITIRLKSEVDKFVFLSACLPAIQLRSLGGWVCLSFLLS